MSHRIQLYHPLVNLFCMLIRSGSRCNYAVAKQSKQRSGIPAVFYFVCLCFYLKCHITLHISTILAKWTATNIEIRIHPDKAPLIHKCNSNSSLQHNVCTAVMCFSIELLAKICPSALHRQWRRLYMIEIFSSGRKTTNNHSITPLTL